jgi:K+-transporting ATPase ATPase C chain
MSICKTAIKMFLLMTVLTGAIYPAIITVIAQLSMPHRANGSLLKKEDRVIGSVLIAQKTTDDRYFWPRPSAIDYNPIKPSGGSNLGPISNELKEKVAERKSLIGKDAPPEMLFSSGSGLDPHISLEAVYYQIPRVAKARSMDEESLKKLIHSTVERKAFNFLRPRYVNVLLLNEALDDNRR